MNLKTALDPIKAVIAKVYKDREYLKEVLDSYLNTLKQSVSKEGPNIEIDILETSRVKELRGLSNKQTRADNGYTTSPIFVIQDIEAVGLLNEEYHTEEKRCDGYSSYIYNYDTETYNEEEALIKIAEAVEEGRTETIEAIEEYPDYKTDHNELKEVWESISDGFTTGAGLCKYIYTDRAWFLTKDRAEEHLENKRYKYNNPRIYIKSLIYTDFELLLKDMGFKHYG